MSETLYSWLNNEIKLSAKITNIPNQFSNGFYFGEILSKYQLLPQFNEFNNDFQPLHITKNFSLLQKKFSDLGINLTEVDKGEIIQRKKFKAEMFLFKIKQKLSSMLLNIDDIYERTKNKSNLKTFYKALNMRNYNNVIKKFENNEKIAMLKEKEKIIERRKKLKSARLPNINKFEKNLNDFYAKNNNHVFNKKLINEIINDNKNTENEIKNKKENIFNLESSKHKENINKEKNEILSFNKNIKNLNEFKQKIRDDKNKPTKFYSNAVENAFQKSFKDNRIFINEFDENLSKLGLDMKLIDPKLEKMKGKTISTEIFMQRIKEQIDLKEKQKKIDDIRKKRIQSAQTKQNKIAIFNRPASAFTTTNTNNLNFSKKSTRPQSSFPLISKNKKNKPKNKLETIKENVDNNNNNINFWDDYIPVDEFNEKRFFDALDKETYNFHLMITKNKIKKKEKYSPYLKGIVYKLVDLVDECVYFQQKENSDLINLNEWKLLMEKFIHDETIKVDREEKKIEISEEEIGNYNFDINNKDENINKKFDKYETEELMNYLNYVGDYNNNNNNFNLKLDFYDVLENDIEILVDFHKKFPEFDDEDYVVKNNNNNVKRNSDKIDYREIYLPREDELELLKLPQNYIKNTLFANIIKELIQFYINNNILNTDNPFEE